MKTPKFLKLTAPAAPAKGSNFPLAGVLIEVNHMKEHGQLKDPLIDFSLKIDKAIHGVAILSLRTNILATNGTAQLGSQKYDGLTVELIYDEPKKDETKALGISFSEKKKPKEPISELSTEPVNAAE